MASLKEIKGRIASVSSTLKITSAMKMVSSAKLHRMQGIAAALTRYEEQLQRISAELSSSSDKLRLSKWIEPHKRRSTALLLAISSDSSLCGAFNNNILKALKEEVERLKRRGYERVIIYPIGEKITQALSREKYEQVLHYRHLISKPDYEPTAVAANALMESYVKEEVDAIYVLHNHFFSMGRQAPICQRWLPMHLPELRAATREYILEPNGDKLQEELLPYTLRTQLYHMLLDSSVAEHAARMIAMQTATDNAGDLLEELRLSYNKHRQQAITEELADISQNE